MASSLAARAIVVLLVGCSTASSPSAESASTHDTSPTETASPNTSFTRQACDRLEGAIQAKDLREATATAIQMAAAGYPTSPGDVTVVDPRILVDAWVLLDAYRHDDVPRYRFALGTLREDCRALR